MTQLGNLSTTGLLGYAPEVGLLQEQRQDSVRMRARHHHWYVALALNITITSRADKLGTFVCDTVPVPFEHLDDNILVAWRRSFLLYMTMANRVRAPVHFG